MTINKGQFAEVTMFPMLADPMWETLGLMGTGLIFFLSSVFTRLTIRRAYLSSDGKRLGFETYTMLGGGGRKIEAPLGNVSMEPLGNKPNASWLRIAIIGLEKPLLMAADGIFHNRPELIRLLNTKVSNVVPKEERVIQRNLSRRRKS